MKLSYNDSKPTHFHLGHMWTYLGLPLWFRGFPGGASGKEPVCQFRRCKEMLVRSLSWEDPLEEGMATHSSILARRILMDRGAWWATVHGVTKSRTQQRD